MLGWQRHAASCGLRQGQVCFHNLPLCLSDVLYPRGPGSNSNRKVRSTTIIIAIRFHAQAVSLRYLLHTTVVRVRTMVTYIRSCGDVRRRPDCCFRRPVLRPVLFRDSSPCRTDSRHRWPAAPSRKRISGATKSVCRGNRVSSVARYAPQRRKLRRGWQKNPPYRTAWGR